MKKIIKKNEIDLNVFLDEIIKKKIKIIFIILLITIIGFLYTYEEYRNYKPIYKVSTNFKKITMFEESEYDNWNFYIYSYSKNFNANNSIKSNILDNNRLPIINSEYLFNIFLESINNVNIIYQSLEESNLVKNNKFIDEKLSGLKLIEILNSIKVFEVNEKEYKIELVFENNNNDQINLFLTTINNSINKIIKEFLSQKLKTFILSQKKILTEISLIVPLDQSSIDQKSMLDYYQSIINELEKELKDTPIMLSGKFNSGNIMTESKEIKIMNLESKKKLINSTIYFLFVGLIISILYVLISNRVNDR